MSASINRFRGEFDFLSNFYAAPVTYAGREWPTSEHAYQAHKSKVWQEQEKIRATKTPREAKLLGRTLPQIRKDWGAVSYEIMHEIVEAKFTQHPDLMRKLKDTGDAILVEGNTWGDVTWGMVQQDDKWVGQNWLGRILMDVRSKY